MTLRGDPLDLSVDLLDAQDLSDRMSSLLFSDLASDVRFRVAHGEGPAQQWEDIPAHRVFLAAASHPFRVMLLGSFQESAQPVISLEEVSSHTFKALLRFVYTGRCSVSQSEAFELLAAADRFGVEALKSASENYLCNTVDADNACRLLEFGRSVNSDAVTAKCLRVIQTAASRSYYTDRTLLTSMHICKYLKCNHP